MLLGTMVAGFCYGACLSVLPRDDRFVFGVKNLGVNYGLVFNRVGAGGVFGGLIGGRVRDLTGTYLYAFLIAAALCLVGAGLTFLIKQPREAHEASPTAESEA
jgi:OFA family oxalate/formate antiporter-like MFS transporter